MCRTNRSRGMNKPRHVNAIPYKREKYNFDYEDVAVECFRDRDWSKANKRINR